MTLHRFRACNQAAAMIFQTICRSPAPVAGPKSRTAAKYNNTAQL
jgi:hypothetical protein